jgi:integrase/recombinase XerD
MSDKPVSPLRQRMIEDMSVRNFNEKTRNDYIRQVRTFAAFLRRSPDTATPEDLRRYQFHQTQTGVRPPGMNAAVSALRFFFTVTLDRPEMARHLTVVREPRRIPAILSPDEVARLLEAVLDPSHKAALSVAYGAGLRVSEVVALKVSDIDSKRMLLKVEQVRGARIDSRCSRRSCSYCYVSGIVSRDHGSGCFPVRTRPTILRHASSTA